MRITLSFDQKLNNLNIVSPLNTELPIVHAKVFKTRKNFLISEECDDIVTLDGDD